MTLQVPGVYIDEGASSVRAIAGASTSVAAFIGRARKGPVNEPRVVHSFAEYVVAYGDRWRESTMGYAVEQYFGNGGGEALIVRIDNGESPLVAADYTGAGLQALDQAASFNLLCVPPPTFEGDFTGADWDKFAAYCATRRAMLIVDPPVAWTDARKALAGLAGWMNPSPNAAAYFPRVRMADPMQGGLREFAPCGVVTGAIARTDADRGVWKAPAGVEALLSGVEALSASLTDLEAGELNPLGLNCLRSFPGVGPVIWGARTRAGADTLASEWKYLPVRRLALHVEESLHRGTQWVVFEPNGEALWSTIRLNVGAFMNSMFHLGAFQGVTPEQAYFVKCDGETTTASDIDLGVVNFMVGFAPIKPAEFIVIKIRQRAGEAGK